MTKTTPMTASAMTSGRFEPTPPDTVPELTTSSLEAEFSAGLKRRRES